MFDFGKDMVMESYRIPWLIIWIQVLVMFLLTLTILLSYFGFVVADSSPGNCLSTSSPRFHTPFNFPKITQVPRNQEPIGEITSSTSNRTRAIENNSERGGFSTKRLAPSPILERFHPCRYLDLAKQAFLKCLGLGSASLNSPADEHQD